MKLTLVVVLYKLKPEESKTFLTLKKYLFSQKGHLNDFELILYDNSPESYAFSPDDYKGVHIDYIHDPRNRGIVPAYNQAWKRAVQNGSQWLLLLDHDTELTEEYIRKILSLKEFPKEIAAAVPKIQSEGQMISPVFSDSLRPLTEDKPIPGIQEKPVMAINSGALVSVGFLNNIGGFNENFPLDYLDHWLFYEIYAAGCKVMLLDATLEHELSVLDYSRVSLARYKSIMHSEIQFYQLYKTELYGAYKKQLAKRFLKQMLTVRNKKIPFYTLKKLLTLR